MDPQPFAMPFSAAGLARGENQLRALVAPFMGPNAPEGIVKLGGGLPPPEAFPLTRFEFELCTGATISWDAAKVPKVQQYQGRVACLEDWVAAWCAERGYGGCGEHGAAAGWSTAISGGNTDAIDKVLALLTDPGDTMLCERYTYSTALDAAQGHRLRRAAVESDGDGLVPAR